MKTLCTITACILSFLAGFRLYGQEMKFFVSADHKDPGEFFVELSLQSGVNIIYSENVIQDLPPVTLMLKGANLEQVLDEVLTNTNVGYRFVGEQIVLYQKEIIIKKYSISGIVTDSVSGEPLISAYVFEERSGKSTFTNEYGYFSLLLPEGEANLLSGYAGYHQEKELIGLEENVIIQLKLVPERSILQEIVVHETKYGNKNLAQPVEVITLNDLKNNLQLGGTRDIYRSSDFVPGIQTGTDGVGGIHVRGGTNDQNLILMDGVPVYYPNHLLGIVSVFNYQVLQQATIYKTNFPSRYGGRLSSVIDVRTREGNINKWGLAGNVGVSEFGLMTEGPLVQGKVGILLAGRFFLPGIFMPDLTGAYKKRNEIEGYSDLDYYDFNGKINWKIGLRDRIYLSMYTGSDKFFDYTVTDRDEIDDDSQIRVVSHEEFDKKLKWANRTGVLRWNHILNDKMFSNFILSSSSFVLQSVDKSIFNFSFPGTSLDSLSGFDTKEFKSGITDITAKIELDIRPTPDHLLSAGAYGIKYEFQPKSISHNEKSQVGEFVVEEGLLDDALFAGFKVRALEAGIYGEDRWEIKEGITLTSGMHISGFFVQRTYYIDPQLRLNFEYQPEASLAFNVGYSRMTQYLHNLKSSSIGLPTDLWVPTTQRVSPELSDQYAISAFWKPINELTIDASAYLKDMRNLISYEEGASFLLPEGPIAASIIDAGNWESRITAGEGHAAGAELQFILERRNYRVKLNGTWAKSTRRFDDINNDLPYPYRYDRRWSGTFSGQYHLNGKLTAGLNFIYGTGIAITLAESKFFNPGFIFPALGINYSDRNAFRLPPYHRMDILINYLLEERESFHHSLSLHLYNVYNRTNPFYVTLVQDPVQPVFEFKQFSLFRFFPSLTYRFVFR